MANSSRSEREAARRARVEALRREQQAKERRRTLAVIGGLAVVILIVVALVGYTLISGGSSSASRNQIIPAPPEGQEVTVQKAPATVPNATGRHGVIAYDTKGYPSPGKADAGTLSHEHVTGPVTYAVVPPVGGDHNPIWMNAGVYTDPIPSERAVHNLEHGAVWITYRPNLPDAQVQALTDFEGRQRMIDEPNSTGGSNRFIDLSPWSDNTLPSPIVISSWGYQLKVNSPTDPRLQQFVDTFRHNQKYSPEFGAAVDGVPVQTGGEPAEDGSANPNPAGAVPNQ